VEFVGRIELEREKMRIQGWFLTFKQLEKWTEGRLGLGKNQESGFGHIKFKCLLDIYADEYMRLTVNWSCHYNNESGYHRD
jgi:hypothetical protein